MKANRPAFKTNNREQIHVHKLKTATTNKQTNIKQIAFRPEKSKYRESKHIA